MSEHADPEQLMEKAEIYMDHLRESGVPDRAILTSNKCPNKCGGLLYEWNEMNGEDDERLVSYCPNCEERWDE